jgi:hypothetical protein
MSDQRRDGAIDLAIDLAIDKVARQMTTGELPSDFRARVVARIAEGGPPRRRWRAAWILSPIAAVAVMTVAIFIARGFQPRVTPQPSSQTVAATRKTPPVESVRRPAPTAPSGEADPKGPALRRGPKRGRMYTTSEIDALAPPRLEVAPLGLEALPTESIAVPRLDAIAPIAVEPLPTNDQPPIVSDPRP